MYIIPILIGSPSCLAVGVAPVLKSQVYSVAAMGVLKNCMVLNTFQWSLLKSRGSMGDDGA